MNPVFLSSARKSYMEGDPSHGICGASSHGQATGRRSFRIPCRAWSPSRRSAGVGGGGGLELGGVTERGQPFGRAQGVFWKTWVWRCGGKCVECRGFFAILFACLGLSDSQGAVASFSARRAPQWPQIRRLAIASGRSSSLAKLETWPKMSGGCSTSARWRASVFLCFFFFFFQPQVVFLAL